MGNIYHLVNPWYLLSQPMCIQAIYLLFVTLPIVFRSLHLHLFQHHYYKCEEHVQFYPSVEI